MRDCRRTKVVPPHGALVLPHRRRGGQDQMGDSRDIRRGLGVCHKMVHGQEYEAEWEGGGGGVEAQSRKYVASALLFPQPPPPPHSFYPHSFYTMLAVAFIALAASLAIASPVPAEMIPSNSALGCFVKTVDGDTKLVHKYNVNDLRQDKNVVQNAESEAVFARCCNNEPPAPGDDQRVGSPNLAADKARVYENAGHREHAPFEDVNVDENNGNRKASVSEETPVDPKENVSAPKPPTANAQRVQNNADPTSNQLDPKLNAFENIANEYATDDARVNDKKVDENARVQEPVGANNRKSSPSVAAEESVPAPAQKSDPTALESNQLAPELNTLKKGPKQKVGSNAKPSEENVEADVEPSNQRTSNEHEELSANESNGAPSTDLVKELEGDVIVKKPTENGTNAKSSKDTVEADADPSNQRVANEQEQVASSKKKLGAKSSQNNVDADVEPSNQRIADGAPQREHEQVSGNERHGAPSTDLVKELEGDVNKLEADANPGQPKEKVVAKMGEQTCKCP
ncbi:hypothetical protein MKEN_01142000 [Mycena kentingensis (nom. inval.)]|nr:hypothetical protein MKEN_01142000 [Mycena kentingensis (nom. inval.)]